MIYIHYSERYGALLKTNLNNPDVNIDLRYKIISSLNPKVIVAFQNGIHNVEDLIQIGGELDKLDCPGVYLHISWKSGKVL